ncbi:MAG: AbrB/MazE/SpoVT family DNA-binding domain-containing protein [Roseitalea sp.]|jgi:antitoxin VapB|uniref:AbrB/MazE/SpoVT family DNA-binding domain-containing protein n=1 Tax=Oceaniradius stylonematis TaxID=2184161 RepID=A0A3A8ADR5_9HYPH|nr:AbrB/MazE/SpoVT family DNA-binding domain-containing protein [Oceaniradius stylonematis]MBO6551872.1 AbrB/MazE/SpoVT family DNA-binding domain-containing protein [Roseitalea sp.]MBO6951748.1 AbrB/MazE/SpoVT family DNA-binding domain-containing protein [Rhizobiaceae bacterium]RNC95812.1 MAG: AbrB/MazE/SpoVT family DNA-binding domain-containing protein [Oricola sp.]MBO6592406.1 AbrB/MazE/SpoVT family DNA-binding domain-containing protein [Roseitalea sp.]MBO6598661.1 AbrB/MazE/SpoVT family DNA
MNEHVKSADERLARLFRNGRSQAVRIPKEFEFAGDELILTRQPDGSLLLRQAQTAGLLDYLRTAEPWHGDDFLAGIDDMPPLDDVEL